MVVIHPAPIVGHWKAGAALDRHTISSVPIGPNKSGHVQFDNKRTEIAELLFKLKYRGDKEASNGIIEAAANFLRPYLGEFDALIPVPPSAPRVLQPVLYLANGIGAVLRFPVVDCIDTTRGTTQLKGVTDPKLRMEIINGLYTLNPAMTEGKRILLFDDIFRSGTTMNNITDVLLGLGKARSVDVLTITKTRSNH